jgi:hypothetical protein
VIGVERGPRFVNVAGGVMVAVMSPAAMVERGSRTEFGLLTKA